MKKRKMIDIEPNTYSVRYDGGYHDMEITETYLNDDGSYSSDGRSMITEFIFNKCFKGDLESCFCVRTVQERTYGPPIHHVYGAVDMDAKEFYKMYNPNNDNISIDMDFINKPYSSVEFFKNTHKGKKERAMIKTMKLEDF